MLLDKTGVKLQWLAVHRPVNGNYMWKKPRGAVMQHLVVMLPVLNEALGLAWVLDHLPYERLEAMGYKTTCSGDGRPQHGRHRAGRRGTRVLLIDQHDIGKALLPAMDFEKRFAWTPMRWLCWMLTAPMHCTEYGAPAGSP